MVVNGAMDIQMDRPSKRVKHRPSNLRQAVLAKDWETAEGLLDDVMGLDMGMLSGAPSKLVRKIRDRVYDKLSKYMKVEQSGMENITYTDGYSYSAFPKINIRDNEPLQNKQMKHVDTIVTVGDLIIKIIMLRLEPKSFRFVMFDFSETGKNGIWTAPISAVTGLWSIGTHDVIPTFWGPRRQMIRIYGGTMLTLKKALCMMLQPKLEQEMEKRIRPWIFLRCCGKTSPYLPRHLRQLVVSYL